MAATTTEEAPSALNCKNSRLLRKLAAECRGNFRTTRFALVRARAELSLGSAQEQEKALFAQTNAMVVVSAVARLTETKYRT